MSATLLLLLQTAAVWYSTGFIWTMQVLNYPLLAQISADSFVAYETAHNRRFIRVVGPGVVVAAATTLALLFVRPAHLPFAAVLAAAVLLASIIVLTATLQAPAHARLARGYDPQVLQRLIRSNAIRAILWTALGILDLGMIYLSMNT